MSAAIVKPKMHDLKYSNSVLQCGHVADYWCKSKRTFPQKLVCCSLSSCEHSKEKFGKVHFNLQSPVLSKRKCGYKRICSDFSICYMWFSNKHEDVKIIEFTEVLKMGIIMLHYFWRLINIDMFPFYFLSRYLY